MRVSRGRESGRGGAERADELAVTIDMPDAGPLALPVRWATTTRPVIDIGSGLALEPQRRAYASIDDSRTVQRITAQFRAIPDKRAVIVGAPGSGRTSLVRLLARGLLQARQPGRAVPVLFPLDGWDPSAEPLTELLVRLLADRCYQGRDQIPRALLGEGLIIPLLDGLDSVPEPLRRAAVLDQHDTFEPAGPLALTCRPADLDTLLRDGLPALHDAPAFTLLPV
ncbi:hypothetical protein, partial [Actinocorallia lasiicapitis]